MIPTNAPEPGKFRKKPVVIEAVQWDGTFTGMRAIEAAIPTINTIGTTYHEAENRVSYWRIGTLEGGHIVSPGDWIITGVMGEHYPCKPDIFAATYEPAALATPPIAVQPADAQNRSHHRAIRRALVELNIHASLPWGQPGYPIPVPGADVLYEARKYLEGALASSPAVQAAEALTFDEYADINRGRRGPPHPPTADEPTQEALSAARSDVEEAFERGRQLGMVQERALWRLARDGQEIEQMKGES